MEIEVEVVTMGIIETEITERHQGSRTDHESAAEKEVEKTLSLIFSPLNFYENFV